VAEAGSRVVSIEIQGQRYAIRSSLDPAYVAELGSYVDAKLAAAAEVAPTGDSLRIAVLAALNIADDYFRSRHTEQARTGRLIERTEQLERLVELALERVEA
jgi:cell division protein ZapA